jgi:hypothetical protein
MTRELHRPWIRDVALTHVGDECLLWPFAVRGGRPGEGGYPALAQRGYAHVLLCEIVHGAKPAPRHEVEHLCGTKLCMNPRHVAWALHRDNCARRTEHGTQTIGTRHGMAKLTDEDVRAIRRVPRVYGTGRALAEQYGVTSSMIWRIRNRLAWKHL